MSPRRLLLAALLAAMLVTVAGAGPVAAQEPAAPAAAQTPQPPDADDPDAEIPDDPHDGILGSDEVPPESTPDPSDDGACVPGEGQDGEQVYCIPCPEEDGTPDGDYAYCEVHVLGEEGRGVAGGGDADPATDVRPVKRGTLPLTGGWPAVPGLLGVGLLLTGLGLRRLSAGGPRPSA